MKKWTPYIKPYLKYFILGPLCMIVEVVGEMVMPSGVANIIDNGVTAGNWSYLVLCALGLIVTAVVMMAGGVGGSYFGAKASVNFAADLREDVFRKVQHYSFANIDKFSAGSLVTRLTNDVTQLQNFVNVLLRMALRSPGMLIGALIMAISYSPSLSVVLAVTLPIMAVMITVLIVFGFPRFSGMQKKVDALNSTVQENVTNVRVVKSFVREPREKEKFSIANEGLKKAGMSAMGLMIFMSPVMTLCMNLTSLAVLLFGGQMVLGDTMTVGSLTAFITYITQVLSSLMMVSMLFVFASRALASARRIREVLDEQVDITDETAAHPDAQVTRGEIEFRGVGFRYYKSSEEQALCGIDLKIEAGSTVGIIGSTGCGKTTLVSMIPRLYDVDEGAVLIDGIDVRDYSLYNLREGVGMVLQKNVLFSGTIAENLRWGDEDATDEELAAAASYAQADGFVSGFAEGYDTELGQGGVNVSGGQKQRLCIARALLKKPKILILDDSTSAVDTATEARIRAAFRNELKDSTKIIIAQRIGSVREADAIIVMEEGRIVGVGTHDSLLADNETYREICASQLEQEEVCR